MTTRSRRPPPRSNAGDHPVPSSTPTAPVTSWPRRGLACAPRPGAALVYAPRQDRGPGDLRLCCCLLRPWRPPLFGFASSATRASSLASPRGWRKLLRILLARCSRFCGNNIQARPTGDFLIPSGGPWVQHRNWPPDWTLILGCNSKMRSAGYTNLRCTILTTPPMAHSSFLSPFGITCFV